MFGFSKKHKTETKTKKELVNDAEEYLETNLNDVFMEDCNCNFTRKKRNSKLYRI